MEYIDLDFSQWINIKKVIYYSDEQNDVFTSLTINAKEVPENFLTPLKM